MLSYIYTYTCMSMQEQTKIKIRIYYQNKFNTLKRILDVYQEKVARRNAFWEEKVRVSHKRIFKFVLLLPLIPNQDSHIM